MRSPMRLLHRPVLEIMLEPYSYILLDLKYEALTIAMDVVVESITLFLSFPTGLVKVKRSLLFHTCVLCAWGGCLDED